MSKKMMRCPEKDRRNCIQGCDHYSNHTAMQDCHISGDCHKCVPAPRKSVPTDKEMLGWMEKHKPCCFEWDGGLYKVVAPWQCSDDGSCGTKLTVRSAIRSAMKGSK